MSSVFEKVNHISILIVWLCVHFPPTVGKPLYDPNNKDTKSEMLFGTMEKVSSNVIRIGLYDSGSNNSGGSGSTDDFS
ncbi:36387_t:CDS:2, partial [Gigaspora margarita]